MKRCRTILVKFLFPHPALLVLLTVISALLLVRAFTLPAGEDLTAYAAYVLSAYTLTGLCARGPAVLRLVRRLKMENRHLRRYTSDAGLRVRLSLSASLLSNGLYTLFQLSLGIWHGSIWYYALAVYYGLLLVMRVALIRPVARGKAGEDRIAEYRLYRGCGAVLTLMNAALAVIVFYIVNQGRGFTHHPITTIAIAAYTFYTFTIAIVNVVRYRRYNSPVFSAAKTVSLAAALVSMLTLETAMLNAFGSEEELFFRRVMTASTGGAVCILVLGIGVWMIVKATGEINRLK